MYQKLLSGVDGITRLALLAKARKHKESVSHETDIWPMRHYNPDKMIPVEVLGPVWSYVFKGGKTKALGFRPTTAGERKFLKDYHTRRARRAGKRIEDE